VHHRGVSQQITLITEQPRRIRPTVVPGQLQEKIIEKAKAERGEVKEEEE